MTVQTSNINRPIFSSSIWINYSLSAELRCSGPDWHEFGDFCYKAFSDKKTWHDARESCRKLGADLVSILSMVEQSWLESYLYLCKNLQKIHKNTNDLMILVCDY